MDCPKCDTEMQVEEVIFDSPDPRYPGGHRQNVQLLNVCENCGEQYAYEPQLIYQYNEND